MRWRRTCTRPRTAGDLGADPARLALGGDSAGGNLAAVTAQSVRNRGLRPPAFQLLIYPVTDIAAKTESYRTFSLGFSLTERNMDWYADQYVPDPEPARRSAGVAAPRREPLRTASGLRGHRPGRSRSGTRGRPTRAGLPRTACAWRSSAIRVLHGFVNVGGMRSARQAMALTAGALRQGLA